MTQPSFKFESEWFVRRGGEVCVKFFSLDEFARVEQLVPNHFTVMAQRGNVYSSKWIGKSTLDGAKRAALDLYKEIGQ